MSVQTIRRTIELMDVGTVKVDYTQRLEAMIRRSDWSQISPYVDSANFPVKPIRSGEVPIALLTSIRRVALSNIPSLIKEADCLPACLPEMLDLAARQPNLVKRFPILVVEQTWKTANGVFVPCIRLHDIRRHLGLYALELFLPPNFSFAVVRNIQEAQLF